jgi:transcriptional regulator
MWGLARSGLTESEISRKLEVSRQAVHIMLDAARNKVMQALNEAAEVNRIQIQHMEIEKGILVGHSQEFDHKVVITYSPKNGVRLWYAHDQECTECKFDKSWVKTILAEGAERGITLSRKELRLPPPELAKTVFGKILPGVEL